MFKLKSVTIYVWYLADPHFSSHCKLCALRVKLFPAFTACSGRYVNSRFDKTTSLKPITLCQYLKNVFAELFWIFFEAHFHEIKVWFPYSQASFAKEERRRYLRFISTDIVNPEDFLSRLTQSKRVPETELAFVWVGPPMGWNNVATGLSEANCHTKL